MSEYEVTSKVVFVVEAEDPERAKSLVEALAWEAVGKHPRLELSLDRVDEILAVTEVGP